MPWFWFFTPMINLGLVQVNGVNGGTVNLGLGQEVGTAPTNRSNSLQAVMGDLPMGWVCGSWLLSAMTSPPQMQAAARAAMSQSPVAPAPSRTQKTRR